jgi:hypothetical protein
VEVGVAVAMEVIIKDIDPEASIAAMGIVFVTK